MAEVKSHPKASEILNTLMKNLYYPAILGGWFYTFLTKVVEVYQLHSSVIDIFFKTEIAFGFYLIVYYSLSYWDTYNEKVRDYSYKTFLVELIEIIIVFYSFYALGFYNKLYEGNFDSCFCCFYISMVGLIVLYIFWAWIQKYRKFCIDSEQFIRLIVFALGCYIHKFGRYFDYIPLMWMLLMSGLYFTQRVKNYTLIALWDDRILIEKKEFKDKKWLFGIKKRCYKKA